jgi:hypothetical protein
LSIVNQASGYHPDFDLDIERGWEAESELRAVLGELLQGGETVEVKRDDRAIGTGNLYLEYAHKPRGSAEFIDSGLKTTKASYVGFKVGNALLLAPTEAWRYIGNHYGTLRECVVGDNPTKGVVVSLENVVRHLAEAPF